MFRTTALHEDGWQVTCEDQVLEAEGQGYTVGFYGCDVGEAAYDELDPSNFTLSFDIVGDLPSSDDCYFPTVSVGGDARGAELWDGFAVGIYWSDPFNGCI